MLQIEAFNRCVVFRFSQSELYSEIVGSGESPRQSAELIKMFQVQNVNLKMHGLIA